MCWSIAASIVHIIIITYNLSAEMTDKAKYASHGTYIKKITENELGKQNKPISGVIHPLPAAKPREKPYNQQQQNMLVQSKTFNAKFKFQQPVVIKPVSVDLIQPFLYIEKVKNKAKHKKDSLPENQRVKHKMQVAQNAHNLQSASKAGTDEKEQSATQKAKERKLRNVAKSDIKPFVIPLHTRGVKGSAQQALAKPPAGYNNLYQFQADKANTANLLFQKMLEAGVENPVEVFNVWNKNARRNLTKDINIGQQQFTQFIKQMIPNKVSTGHIKHFFKLYNNSALQNEPKRAEKVQKVNHQSQISIKAFSFNYLKYKRAETQITNILSEKAAKSRYTRLKGDIEDYLKQYPQLKIGMKAVKEYEETMRKHFRRLYEGYKNPFEEEIDHLKLELQKPIIKYDKEKKDNLEKQVQKYQQQNAEIHQKLTDDYNNFMSAYEDAIVKNHDLFFTKRTVVHLLLPIFECEPMITRDLIERQVAIRQEQKQKYLNCLSEIIVEMDNDKKNINENSFTLGEIVSLVNMKFRNKRTKADEQMEALTIQSLKKLVKQIKRQFLIKFNLQADDLDTFPGDQQIPMQILHTCFEMECTKVLFKNRIWTQLLEMLPTRSVESKLHQKTIDANTCMQYLIKYFAKLDQRSTLELNKSKEISLLVENAYNQNFGKYAQIIQTVSRNLDNFVEGAELDHQFQLNKKPKKKVGFADVADSLLAVNRGQKNMLQSQTQQLKIVNNIIKLIHHGAKGADTSASNIMANMLQTNKSGWIGAPQPKREQDTPYKAVENLQMLKSMARSYFQPEAMNTNAFDIRFYEKMAEEEKQNKMPQQQVVELGTSMLLLGAPRPQQIEGSSDDPLRISRFLLKTIDKDVKEQQKTVQNKQYESGIYDGVSNNYYREKIKIENKPTRYDSEGKSKYSVLLPVGYYESYIVGQNVPDQQKWYLRAHHVETLTENPLSKKDNVINTEYQSKLQKLGAKKRPDQHVIQENVNRKQSLISQLQQRIQALKGEVNRARRQKDIPGYKVPPTVVDNYYRKIAEGKQDKDLQLAAYQGVLYDLRRKQRGLLNQYRSQEQRQRGTPHDKWWEKKDRQFNRELRKDRNLTVDQSGVHTSYVQKLKNNEIY